jgi:alpha-L-fucosidase 2
MKFVSLVIASCLGIAASGAELKTNIEYAKAGTEHLRLDAGIPDGAGPFPAVIIVHGGGWTSGNKQRDVNTLFEPLAAAHFTWFSINYRLAPSNPWPDCFEDTRTAIRWIKLHAAEFKADPNRIGLIGYSAGGQLVCQAAALAGDDTRVQAVVGLAAPTDLFADTHHRGGLSKSMKDLLGRTNVDDAVDAALWEISPINHVAPGLPPFLLIHGTSDQSVPYEQSLNFQAKLKASGVRCDLITLTNAPHNIRNWETVNPAYKQEMVAWLQRTLGEAK